MDHIPHFPPLLSQYSQYKLQIQMYIRLPKINLLKTDAALSIINNYAKSGIFLSIGAKQPFYFRISFGFFAQYMAIAKLPSILD